MVLGVVTGPKKKGTLVTFQHGNYHSYYVRNKCKLDERLKTVVREFPEIFRKKRVLDIGCNEAIPIIQVASVFGAGRCEGVDLSRNLILTAVSHLRSFKEYSEASNSCVKKPELENKLLSLHPVEVLDCAKLCSWESAEEFPLNVEVRCADFLRSHLEKERIQLSSNNQYDVILCLSLTKWIHINEGDSGIQKLFNKISEILCEGGFLICQFQKFEEYRRPKKDISQRNLENLEEIKLLPSEFSTYIQENCGMTLESTLDLEGAEQTEKVTNSRTMREKRSIMIFRKTKMSRIRAMGKNGRSL
eukprot:GHVP01068848.1.p1 GENE.GHVP01068848.1~~GHVP01068848.1.p1  ORF type:complete len:303 (+),score=57.26 GHVP01068848.1:361-1269(+)